MPQQESVLITDLHFADFIIADATSRLKIYRNYALHILIAIEYVSRQTHNAYMLYCTLVTMPSYLSQ